MTYLIRDIKETDLDELMLLIREHTAFEKAGYDATGKKERLAAQLFGGKSQLTCWVIEMEGKVNGFCSFTYDYSTWDAGTYMYMDCLYLRSSIRGQGIGSVIIERLSVEARERGCVNVQWHTPTFNTRAIAFYRKIGATEKNKVRFTLPVITSRTL